MKIIGIDGGGTNTQVVLYSPEKTKYLISEKNSKAFELIKKRVLEFASYPIAITGGEAKKIEKLFEKAETKIISEIESIGIGGTLLTGKKKVLIVNIGTGTAIVAVNKNEVVHLGGTGMGGGTLGGFSQLIFKDRELDKLEKLAQTGSREKVDLTVKDIVGSGIGSIPANATASNLGKLASSNTKDLAAGLFNMLSESIATLAFFIAKNHGLEQDIVFCGKVAQNKVIKKRLQDTVRMWGGKAIIPLRAEYASAVGAAKQFWQIKNSA